MTTLVTSSHYLPAGQACSRKLSTAIIDLPPITPASATRTQAAAPPNPHRRQAARQTPRVPSLKGFRTGPLSTGDRSVMGLNCETLQNSGGPSPVIFDR